MTPPPPFALVPLMDRAPRVRRACSGGRCAHGRAQRGHSGARAPLLLAALCALLLAALPARAGDPAGAYAHAFVAATGAPMPLAAYAGRPILVVNTGIYCDSPGQHDGLQALWERFRGQGLVVIAVPSDDFRRADEAGAGKTFCAMNLALDYPMTRKVRVAGPAAHAFYRWAGAAVREDYTKILVGPDGHVSAVFSAAVAPLDPALVEAVRAALPPGG